MNCARHPSKRAVVNCRDCGADFCIECVRETDQTTYCYDCYRRRIDGLTRGFSAPPLDKAEAAPAGMAREESPREQESLIPGTSQPAPGPSPAVGHRFGRGRKKEKESLAKPAPADAGSKDEDFLALGPDEDFSDLREARAPRIRPRPGRIRPARGKAEKVAGEAGGVAGERESPPLGGAVPEEPKAAPVPAPRGEKLGEDAALLPEEALLEDVVSALLQPERKSAGAAPASEAVASGLQAVPGQVPGVPAEAPLRGDRRSRREDAKAAARERTRRRKKPEGEAKEGFAERWSFMAQPRSSEYTILAVSGWRSALFVALMILLGAVLWAVPNAFIVPKDQEYGLHAVLIGIILSLCFWWKAGKKHGTKLAVQAALATFFALLVGEYLHWLLVIVKNQALRTVLVDLVTFRFLWESGAEIVRETLVTFLWILALPSVIAFLIGFGLPPIPEIFFQIVRVVRGAPSAEKEAKHGVEG